MSDLVRLVAIGRDACNIHVIPQDAAAFFGTPVDALPEPQLSPEILNTHDMVNDENARFIDLLDVAMVPPIRARRVRFVDMLVPGKFFPFLYEVKSDLQRQMSASLTVYATTSFSSSKKTNLIAEAIAAFVHNNGIRGVNSLPELQEKIMAGIIMCSPRPVSCPAGSHHFHVDVLACQRYINAVLSPFILDIDLLASPP
ncbi:hypothetical protein APHAL10511_005737 [Amanita phalloides]|nr:hypothetical protein APHAL10511_005737 [Amanita phalloides]